MSAVLGASGWGEAAPTSLEGEPAGVRSQVAEVHAEHADFVWRALQRFGVRDADLEDQLQEVFVVVHRQLATYDERGSLPSWLFGIAKRVAAGYRRRAHVKRELPTMPLPESVDDAVGPEDALEARRAREALDAILDELDLDKRAVFVMFEVDELSCEAIAEELGIPLGTVYSRLAAARRSFEKAVVRARARAARGGAR